MNRHHPISHSRVLFPILCRRCNEETFFPRRAILVAPLDREKERLKATHKRTKWSKPRVYLCVCQQIFAPSRAADPAQPSQSRASAMLRTSRLRHALVPSRSTVCNDQSGSMFFSVWCIRFSKNRFRSTISELTVDSQKLDRVRIIGNGHANIYGASHCRALAERGLAMTIPTALHYTVTIISHNDLPRVVIRM